MIAQANVPTPGHYSRLEMPITQSENRKDPVCFRSRKSGVRTIQFSMSYPTIAGCTLAWVLIADSDGITPSLLLMKFRGLSIRMPASRRDL
jgi:hypothetical protein